MNKILTAEEFLNNFRFEAGKVIGNRDFDTMALYAKEFAKLHVQAALEEASEKATLNVSTNDWQQKFVDKDSILNAYPLKNIK